MAIGFLRLLLVVLHQALQVSSSVMQQYGGTSERCTSSKHQGICCICVACGDSRDQLLLCLAVRTSAMEPCKATVGRRKLPRRHANGALGFTPFLAAAPSSPLHPS